MVSNIDKNDFIKRFRRSLKSVKSSNYYFRCDLCEKNITPKMIYILDSRNDKYCPDCAIDIFDAKIGKLQLNKKQLSNELILNELEEDESNS